MDYHNIHVVYTKEAETADHYIEKFAHENGKKYNITVATSDGLEQVIIRGAGCLLYSAREFEKEVKAMEEHIRSDNVKVVNIALSGRSSQSYLSEPEYNTLINGMKQGDYLLIGFGHNDEKTEKERYTSPVGDYMTEGTFANTLYVNYIRKARNAGCYPILCTPIVRRSASGEWKARTLHSIKAEIMHLQ